MANKQNSDKTECPKGHKFTRDNLLSADLNRGRRGCRTCHNQRRLVGRVSK